MMNSFLIIQILYKINHELQYARKDLEEALKHTGGDILAARKRVMWLEDRMGTLCGKVRLRVRAIYFYCQISFTRNKTDESGWFKYFSANQDKTNLVKCQR